MNTNNVLQFPDIYDGPSRDSVNEEILRQKTETVAEATDHIGEMVGRNLFQLGLYPDTSEKTYSKVHLINSSIASMICHSLGLHHPLHSVADQYYADTLQEMEQEAEGPEQMEFDF